MYFTGNQAGHTSADSCSYIYGLLVVFVQVDNKKITIFLNNYVDKRAMYSEPSEVNIYSYKHSYDDNSA